MEFIAKLAEVYVRLRKNVKRPLIEKVNSFIKNNMAFKRKINYMRELQALLQKQPSLPQRPSFLQETLSITVVTNRGQSLTRLLTQRLTFKILNNPEKIGKSIQAMNQFKLLSLVASWSTKGDIWDYFYGKCREKKIQGVSLQIFINSQPQLKFQEQFDTNTATLRFSEKLLTVTYQKARIIPLILRPFDKKEEEQKKRRKSQQMQKKEGSLIEKEKDKQQVTPLRKSSFYTYYDQQDDITFISNSLDEVSDKDYIQFELEEEQSYEFNMLVKTPSEIACEKMEQLFIKIQSNLANWEQQEIDFSSLFTKS